MLVVETIAKIRRAHFVEGKLIKQICRELRLSRNTVRKVIRSGATEFTYDCTTQPRPKIDPWRPELDDMLAEKASAIEPDYGEPYAGLSETSLRDWFAGSKSTLDRAYDLAKQASSLDPLLPLVQKALSTVYPFRREHDAAIKTARRWIELEPSDAEAYAALAGARHFAGQNRDVIPLIETAMRLNPYFPFYYPHYIGLDNMTMGRSEDAAGAFRRAISRNPDTLWPHFFLAASLGHLSQRDGVREAWNEVKRIQPYAVVGQVTLLPYKNVCDAKLVLEGFQKAGLSP
jgi:tetratricopeptide (TPR) repeat protein